MKFTIFANYLDKLEKTPSRLEITSILSDLFSKTQASEIERVTYLSLGVLAPNYDGLILNLAEKMMIRVLSQAYNVDEGGIVSLYKEKGDLGNVAQEFGEKLGMKDEGLSVGEVYDKLTAIANDSGEGSQDRKVEKMSSLLRDMDPLSARFIARIPVGRLRLGFSEKTIIDALSKAYLIPSEEIESAYNIRPDIGYVARLTNEGNVKSAKPEVGVPVVPMLAARLNSTTEMIKKMGEVSVEPKFDGLRIFIHYQKPSGPEAHPGQRPFIKIFTRNMNNLDPSIFPELNEIGKYIKAESVILDTEAVGLDPQREGFVDFQKTIQRRRKHNVAKSSEGTPLQFQVFDILILDGKSLINDPYIERRKILEKVVVNGGLFRIDENTVTKDPNVIKKLHEKYLEMGLEGVVVKKSNGGYVSGRTGWNWVKMKEVEGTRGKLSDTLDCVVMGYTSGKGKRVGFGIGQFLAGVKDGDTFKTITKVGTGLTDEQFRELNRRLKDVSSKEKPKEYLVDKALEPDFWALPKVVVELAADEITVSPNHTAGLALRFPRLVRFRDDKSSNDITTNSELRELLKLQKS